MSKATKAPVSLPRAGTRTLTPDRPHIFDGQTRLNRKLIELAEQQGFRVGPQGALTEVVCTASQFVRLETAARQALLSNYVEIKPPLAPVVESAAPVGFEPAPAPVEPEIPIIINSLPWCMCCGSRNSYHEVQGDDGGIIGMRPSLFEMADHKGDALGNWIDGAWRALHICRDCANFRAGRTSYDPAAFDADEELEYEAECCDALNGYE